MIFGGGDSALDWAIELAPRAAGVDSGASARRISRRASLGTRDARARGGGQIAVCRRTRSRFARGRRANFGRGGQAPRAARSMHSMPSSCWCSLVWHRNSGPSPTGAWSSTSAPSRSIRRNFEIEYSGRFRDRRYQHLSGQEEAHSVGISRSGARGVRDTASSVSGRRSSICNTPPPARRCRSAWA